LDKDRVSPDFDVTKAELFEAISHPVRIKILEALDGKPMGFAELGRVVGIESGGHLSFHLTKLRHLIKTNPLGNYTLTGEGKEALWTIYALQKSSRETSAVAGQTPIRHRSLLKPAVAVILIAVVVLGGFEFYQQSQFSTLQRQVNSEQGMIGALEGGVPFTDGQPASLVIGQQDFSSNLQTWLNPSRDGLNNPSQVLFDPSGNLWVVDSGNSRVLEFQPPFSDGMNASVVIGSGTFTRVDNATTGKGASLCSPAGAAFDSFGDLWVSDSGNERVLEYKPPFQSGMGASIVIGHPNFTVGFVPLTYPSADVLSVPTRIAFDSSGRLWVVDDGHNRVLAFDPPFSDGMDASLVLGQPNFTSSLTSSTLEALGSCGCGTISALAIDSSDNVWIGDPGNNRILEFRPPFSNGMKASLLLDQTNLVANETILMSRPYVPRTNTYNLGTTIVFDSSGNLWTSYFNRLMAFRPPFAPGIRTFPSVEIGQPNFTAIAWLGGQAGLFNPGQPAFDSHGNLWVPDTNNNRVLEFVANSGAGTAGQSSLDPSAMELAVASAATTGVVGVIVAIWFTRRAQSHPTAHPYPV